MDLGYLPQNLWSRAVAIPTSYAEDVFETYDGVPHGDPLSTLVDAIATSLLMTDIIRSKALNVSMVAYVDDTVLLGQAADVTQAISELQVETATGGLKLQKPKCKRGRPHEQLTMNPSSAPFKDGGQTWHPHFRRNCL